MGGVVIILAFIWLNVNSSVYLIGIHTYGVTNPTICSKDNNQLPEKIVVLIIFEYLWWPYKILVCDKKCGALARCGLRNMQIK